jgi:hypothetical protein
MQTNEAVAAVSSKSNAELVAELLSLDPPASASCLTRVARHLWADEEAKPIIDVLTTRPDVDIAWLRWLLAERPYKPYDVVLAKAILRRPECSYDDLRFLYREIRINALRNELTDRLVAHEQTSINLLRCIAEDKDIDPSIRTPASRRISAMQLSRGHQITHQITGNF